MPEKKKSMTIGELKKEMKIANLEKLEESVEKYFNLRNIEEKLSDDIEAKTIKLFWVKKKFLQGTIDKWNQNHQIQISQEESKHGGWNIIVDVDDEMVIPS